VLRYQPFPEGLCPEVLFFPGRPLGKGSPFKVVNLSGSSVDASRQLNKRQLIRRAASNAVPSNKSPEKPEDPMSYWRPGVKGQGWDPGGPRPLDHAQSHPPHSGLRSRPYSHIKTRDSKCLLFNVPTGHLFCHMSVLLSLVYWCLIFFFFAILGFELRALCLLCRCSST
jgi:hypothetical protein